MNKITQEQKVISKLNLDGFVDNFWAIKNFILRLGAVILRLKKQGYTFRTSWGTRLGEQKNYYYFLISKPNANHSQPEPNASGANDTKQQVLWAR